MKKIILMLLFVMLQIHSKAQTNNNMEQKEKNALLVIDIQKDFTSSTARMPVSPQQAEHMIQVVNQLQEEKKDWEIIYIYNSYSRFDLLNIFRNFAAIKNTEGGKMDERLNILSQNLFSKDKTSAFINPKLDLFLKENGINTLYLTGLYSEACVTRTAVAALKRNYKVNIIQDALASKTEKAREKACQRLASAGATILKSGDL